MMKCKIGDTEYTCDNCPINSGGLSGVVSKETMNKYGMCSPLDEHDIEKNNYISIKGLQHGNC